MFKTAYSTTSASSFISSELMAEIAIVKAEGLLVQIDPSIPSLYAILGKDPRSKKIDDFEHPIYMEDKGTNPGTGYWVIDLRPYVSRLVTQDGKIDGAKDTPAALMILRAKCEMYWKQFSPGEMMFWGDLPFVVFPRWLAGILKSRLTLEPTDVSHVQAIVAYYFYCLFIEKDDFTARKKENIAGRINRLLKIDIQHLNAWLKPLDYMSNLNDLALAIASQIDNPAARLVDEKYLLNATVNSWFGSADSRALVAVSLEFPPAFIAMIIACGNTSQWRKSVIGEAVEREKNQHRFGEYQRLAFDSFKSLK